MSIAWALDKVAYVSEYHKVQWEEQIQEFAGLGWVTKNGFDPSLVPLDALKRPNRIIHISRPERGLEPLLAMWPALKAQRPDAELHLCRYNSMYDAQGWGKVCEAFDDAVAKVNAEVGGITYLGELGKAELYTAIARSAVMWYPGIESFAETSCIAALESQANGTPFVGSWKGALPETVPSGVLIQGDAMSPEYQKQSIAAVIDLLDGCARESFAYRKIQQAGRLHVKAYTYDVIAAEWEQWLGQTFAERANSNAQGVLNRLLHYDDHTAAKVLAEKLGDTETVAFCDRVIQGIEQGAEDYATRALDPLQELKINDGRLQAVVAQFEGCTNVLDVACGNGCFALALAQAYPEMHVTGIDYAQANIDAARKAAETLGLSDRLTFLCAPFWDLKTQWPADGVAELSICGRQFDGAFIGEFIEHVANCSGLVDTVEQFVKDGGKIVYTCPYGPFSDLLQRHVPLKRGHVHHFCHDDLVNVFGAKADLKIVYLSIGQAPRGAEVGHWLIAYEAQPNRPAGQRDYAHRIATTRPWKNLTIGLITKNEELNLAKSLQSAYAIADEILIGDTGSTDATKYIAETYGGRKLRWIDLKPVQDYPDGFAGARNAVLQAASGEWFCWLDADEELIHPQDLGKYLDSGGPYRGFALRQQHLMIDMDRHYDTPIRVFAKAEPIQFYGCVHEQPQMGDCNGDITPALELTDCQISHVGYRTEDLRRGKMLNRNLALLARDQKVFPDRRLGKVLWIREFINLAEHEMLRAGGRVSPKAEHYLSQCIGLFEKHFLADPSDKFHILARPWYQIALKHTRIAWEVEVALGGHHGGLNGHHAKPERIWTRSPDDLSRVIAAKAKRLADQMTPVATRVDPVVPKPSEVAA
jgi:SAM-dependent methyltransferase